MTGFKPSNRKVKIALSSVIFWSTKRLLLFDWLLSVRRSVQLVFLAIESICSIVYPAENIPPTILPMLVPTITSGFIPASLNACNTPICESPLAPPPLSVNAISGLFSGTYSTNPNGSFFSLRAK